MFEITISSLEKLKSYLRYSEEHYAGGQGIEEQRRVKTLYETTIEDYDKAIEKLKGKGEKYRIPEKPEIVNTFYAYDSCAQEPEQDYLCPNCSTVIVQIRNQNKIIGRRDRFCHHCGKALDWSGVKYDA